MQALPAVGSVLTTDNWLLKREYTNPAGVTVSNLPKLFP